MNNIFFNTEIISEQSSMLERAADRCLAPLRYLLGGRTVEMWDHTVIEDRQSFTEQGWKKTAAAIVLLIPGFLFGMMAKLVAYILYPSAWRKDTILLHFDQDPFPLDGAISLEVSHARLVKKSDAIKNKMVSKETWSKPEFIEEVSAFMEAAFAEIELFYALLEERHGGDRDKMAKAMIRQSLSYPDDGEINDTTIYAFNYFYDSLTEMYHLARSYSSIAGNAYHFSSLTDEDQEPFFDENTPQYRWRELYNSFCQKLDDYGLRTHLKDSRFENWSVLDDCFVDDYGFPDTRPTR